MQRHADHFVGIAFSIALTFIGVLAPRPAEAQQRHVTIVYDHCVGPVRNAKAEPLTKSERERLERAIAVPNGVTTCGENGYSIRDPRRAPKTSIRVDTLERIDAREHFLDDLSESRHATIPIDPVIEEEAEPVVELAPVEPIELPQPPVVQEARIE